MKNGLLLILLLSSYSGLSQTTKPVTLSVLQAAKIQDSLRVLPLVRAEAQEWRAASGAYKMAADSLQRALGLQQGISQSYQTSLSDQQRLLTSQTAETTQWRSKARKRGVINVLLATLAGLLAFVAITK